MPAITGASHVAFTVLDMNASARWYERIFGWAEFRRFTGEEAGTPRVLLLDPENLFVLALCQPNDGERAGFDHRRTGLDHFGFGVADSAELEEWRLHLESQGVLASPVREVPGLGRLISFEDPDGIQLELWVNG
jgi:glyoxylase I family protein